MNKVYLIVILIFIGACSTTERTLDNPFYAFNNCIRTLPNAPSEIETQVELIKEVGFDGFGGHVGDSYYPRRTALDKVGLTMPELYWGLSIDSVGNAIYQTGLNEIIRDSQDKNLLVALYTSVAFDKHNQQRWDSILVHELRELGEFAASFNTRIAIYPHLGNYCETIDHTLKVVQDVGLKNVGAIFNLCHLLKVEGEMGWEDKLLKSLPYLFMISINGADSGATKQMSWDRLIQPLGDGSFDTYHLVKLAKDHGYQGLFGLQCYNIKQDCRIALRKSMDTWKEYQRRYAAGE